MEKYIIKNVKIRKDKICFDYCEKDVFPREYMYYEMDNEEDNYKLMKENLIGKIWVPLRGRGLYKRFGITHFCNGEPVNTKKNTIYIVHEDWATDDYSGDSVLIATKDFEKAKKCFDEHVKNEIESQKEQGREWIIDRDKNRFSSYEEGYYESAHYDISIIKMELE